MDLIFLNIIRKSEILLYYNYKYSNVLVEKSREEFSHNVLTEL